jgi:epoxyqueuosine reductase
MLFGEILTTLELPPDAPRVTRATPTCGTCTRCLSACPTRALVAPGQIDARRCISYLTIESNSSLPSELGPALKNQVFGCDICQEVCPYNKQFAASSRPHPELASRPIAGEAVPLEELLKIKNSREFLERFAGSPLMRAKREGMIRNALNAAVNCCRETPALRQKFIPLIEEIARNDRQEKLRQLAARALQDLAAGVERAASKKVIS